MIVTDMIVQVVRRTGVKVTIPLRNKIVFESARVNWNAENHHGVLELYLKHDDKADAKKVISEINSELQEKICNNKII
jgi:hypothetical protein